MKKTIKSIICLLLITAGCKGPETTKDNKDAEFRSFLSNFDEFSKQFIDASIFYGRDLRESDSGMPQIDMDRFKGFIPNDNILNCKAEEIIHRPGYIQEIRDITAAGIVCFCNNEISEANLLVTYGKTGKIIDYEYLGFDGTDMYCVLEKSVDDQALTYTQYSFQDTTQRYSGKCDVSIYKVKINNDGTINKEVIKEYEDNLTIEL